MSSDEQAIRDLVRTWHEATRAGDVDRVLPLMAEDVVFLVPGQAAMVGRDAFARAMRAMLTSRRIESTFEIREVVVSGNLAYCWSDLEVAIVALASGETIHRSGPAVSILRKQADGTWAVVRDANMLALKPAEGQS